MKACFKVCLQVTDLKGGLSHAGYQLNSVILVWKEPPSTPPHTGTHLHAHTPLPNPPLSLYSHAFNPTNIVYKLLTRLVSWFLHSAFKENGWAESCSPKFHMLKS